jgi:hypothetical protein
MYGTFQRGAVLLDGRRIQVLDGLTPAEHLARPNSVH